MTVVVLLVGFFHSAGRAQAVKTTSVSAKPCVALGDTITVVGRLESWSSVSILDSMCVFYPDPDHRALVFRLPIADSPIFHAYLSTNHVQLSTYLEVTGTVVDGFASHVPLVALKVSGVREVNEQILELFDRRAADCEEWQADHAEELAQKTHGASPNLITYSAQDGSGHCGMSAVDTVLPHATFTMSRPDPEQSYASLIASMPNPAGEADTTVTDGRMVVDGFPVLPDGCIAPTLLKKHRLAVRTHYSKQLNTTAARAESDLISGGQVEADIIIDGKGRSGGTDAKWIKITHPSSPNAGTLERALSADLQSWLWKPASCSGAAIQKLYPRQRPVQTDQYVVYTLAHIHYDFVRGADDRISVNTEITLGDTRGCKRLKLADAPDPRNGTIGITAPYLVCADTGSPK